MTEPTDKTESTAPVTEPLPPAPAMNDENKAMLISLIVMAWADGRVTAEENELINGLIEAFGANENDTKAIQQFAATPKTLADIPLTELSAGARRTLLNMAVHLTFIDGEQSDKEKELVNALGNHLRIPETEAKQVISAAENRAKRMLTLL